MEELSEEFKGKVDTEAEQELAGIFDIRSIPSILFCLTEDKPQMMIGAMPKQTFVQALNEVLLTKLEV